jgi:hypothetical protein
MRCVACGVEMQLVRTVPDNSMMASGRELGTFECPRCHGKAQRLMSTTDITPFATERMQLPTVSSPLAADAMDKVDLLRRKALVVTRWWRRSALARLRQLWH